VSGDSLARGLFLLAVDRGMLTGGMTPPDPQAGAEPEPDCPVEDQRWLEWYLADPVRRARHIEKWTDYFVSELSGCDCELTHATCDVLCLPRGSTFADAVHALSARRESVRIKPRGPNNNGSSS